MIGVPTRLFRAEFDADVVDDIRIALNRHRTLALPTEPAPGGVEKFYGPPSQRLIIEGLHRQGRVAPASVRDCRAVDSAGDVSGRLPSGGSGDRSARTQVPADAPAKTLRFVEISYIGMRCRNAMIS